MLKLTEDYTKLKTKFCQQPALCSRLQWAEYNCGHGALTADIKHKLCTGEENTMRRIGILFSDWFRIFFPTWRGRSRGRVIMRPRVSPAVLSGGAQHSTLHLHNYSLSPSLSGLFLLRVKFSNFESVYCIVLIMLPDTSTLGSGADN